jgi:hypothetical protein
MKGIERRVVTLPRSVPWSEPVLAGTPEASDPCTGAPTFPMPSYMPYQLPIFPRSVPSVP